ncbi:MAG: hypothetical protein L3I91_02310 [Mycoplasma sp.]
MAKSKNPRLIDLFKDLFHKYSICQVKIKALKQINDNSDEVKELINKYQRYIDYVNLMMDQLKEEDRKFIEAVCFHKKQYHSLGYSQSGYYAKLNMIMKNIMDYYEGVLIPW